MRKENKLFYKDLLILRKLFFSNELPIVVINGREEFQDEKKRLFVFPSKNDAFCDFCNNTSTKFIFVNKTKSLFREIYLSPKMEGAFDFSKKNKKGSTPYYYFNNPNGSMRWIFPKKSKSPMFLNLYNGSGIKANIFKTTVKALHFLSWVKPITSGKFSVFFKNDNTITRHFGEFDFDDFAIFTGTVGENRKAIIALSKEMKCIQFIKIPLTRTAQDLVRNEFQQLSNISCKPFNYLVFPKTRKTETGVAVSNIQPKFFEKNNTFQSIHFKSLAELYQHSTENKMVAQLSIWKTITDGMDFFQKMTPLKNGLSSEKTKQLQTACEHLFYSINSSDFLKVGIGHGDFTPWNMYLGKTKLHLYDWEMCATDIPLLFDVFHYFFQKGILIERKGIEAIEKDIQNSLELPEAKTIISKYQLDWKRNYQIYLLHIVCYYFPKYAVQPNLHEQVFWLVDVWIAGITRVEYRKMEEGTRN